MRVLDLFSGIGGFSLGLERAGMRTVAFCEANAFCCAVLKKHWPQTPIYEDIRCLTARRLRSDGIGIDVLSAGFPCQPFSTAARGRNVARDFWPDTARVIEDVAEQLKYVILENVQEAAIANAARHLERIGFRAYYRCISGADAGADHQRDRWWAIAYPNAQSELRGAIDAEVAKLPELCRGLWGADNYARAIRVPDGVSDRVDRPRRTEAVGNAVFPQIPEALGRAIMACS